MIVWSSCEMICWRSIALRISYRPIRLFPIRKLISRNQRLILAPVLHLNTGSPSTRPLVSRRSPTLVFTLGSLLIGKNKYATFGRYRDKMDTRVSKWSNLLLSFSGHEVLIKSIAQALPQYVMSCYLLPCSLVEEMSRSIRRFWWSGKGSARGWPFVAWADLCQPKVVGGMGFKDLHLFNISLLGKQLWRLLSEPGSLLYRTFRAKYFLMGTCSMPWSLRAPHLLGNVSTTPYLVFGMDFSGPWALIARFACLVIAGAAFLLSLLMTALLIMRKSPFVAVISWSLDNPYGITLSFRLVCLRLTLRRLWRFLSVRAGRTLSFGVIMTRAFILFALAISSFGVPPHPSPPLRAFGRFWPNSPQFRRCDPSGGAVGRDALPVGSRLRDAGLSDGACPLCGASLEDTLHALRDCPDSSFGSSTGWF
ncbi:hypothetical protein GQ457_18G009820 [Hibiscus cannabinus]